MGEREGGHRRRKEAPPGRGSGLPGYLPVGGSVGASGAHRRARGISRIMGGQDGARAQKEPWLWP